MFEFSVNSLDTIYGILKEEASDNLLANSIQILDDIFASILDKFESFSRDRGYVRMIINFVTAFKDHFVDSVDH